MRLHVGVLGAEQLLGAVDRQLLDVVDDHVPAVVALARVALGVLVRQDAPLHRHDGWTGVVFRGDELHVLFLAAFFAADGYRELGVEGLERRGVIEHGWRSPDSGQLEKRGWYLFTRPEAGELQAGTGKTRVRVYMAATKASTTRVQARARLRRL